MSDLRTGLVEAIALSMYDSSTRELRELESPLKGDRFEYHAHAYRQYAAAALDAALGFLTDNAEAWVAQAGWLPADIATGNVRRDLIAALRDSTGTTRP